MSDEAVIEEVEQALARADGPLTTAQVYAQTEMAEGRATVASALNKLVRAGRAHSHEDDDGTRWFRAGAAPQGSASTGAEQDSGRRRGGREAGISDRVRAAVHEAEGPVTSAQIAAVLDVDVQKVRSALSNLQRQQVVRAETLPGGNTKAWCPYGDPAPPADAGRPVRPHRSGGGGPPAPEPPGPDSALASVRPAPAQESEPDAPEQRGAVFAYRSDGAMQIHKGDQAVELTQAEAADLLHYLAPWVAERRREAS